MPHHTRCREVGCRHFILENIRTAQTAACRCCSCCDWMGQNQAAPRNGNRSIYILRATTP
jgi:hypothetical protein